MAAKKVSSKPAPVFSVAEVRHIAKLANLTLTPSEETKFSSQFSETLKMINLMRELDTSEVTPTSQVTGLTNITREDVIDHSRLLSVSKVLGQAAKTYQNYIVVPAVFAL